MEGESTTGPMEAVRMVDVAEAAELMRMSERTVRRMYRSGELDFVKARSRSIRIPLAAIEAYIAAHRNGQSGDAA